MLPSDFDFSCILTVHQEALRCILRPCIMRFIFVSWELGVPSGILKWGLLCYK